MSTWPVDVEVDESGRASWPLDRRFRHILPAPAPGAALPQVLEEAGMIGCRTDSAGATHRQFAADRIR